VFVSAKLKAELQAYAALATCVDRSYPFFASPKSIKLGFNANSLAQTFALIYEGAGQEGASSHSGRRTFLTHLATKALPFTCSRRWPVIAASALPLPISTAAPICSRRQ
jgi:hypothetical protein